MPTFLSGPNVPRRRRHLTHDGTPGPVGPGAQFGLLDLTRFTPPPPPARWVDRRDIADVLAEIRALSVTCTHRPHSLGRHTGIADGRFRGAGAPGSTSQFLLRRRPGVKGGRIAAVPLAPEEGAPPNTFLEVSRPRPAPSQRRQLRARPHRTAGAHSHEVRRLFAERSRRAGTGGEDVRAIYGHTQVETTMIYAPPGVANAPPGRGTAAPG